MIKAIAVVNNRRTLILGLSRLNTEKLLEDQPIPIDLRALLQTAPNVRAIDDVWIVGGETEENIVDQLRSFGLDL